MAEKLYFPSEMHRIIPTSNNQQPTAAIAQIAPIRPNVAVPSVRPVAPVPRPVVPVPVVRTTAAVPRPVTPIARPPSVVPAGPIAAMPRPVTPIARPPSVVPRTTPLSPGASIRVALPVQQRPIMTPVLTGGRAQIPVQIPRAVPTATPALPPITTPIVSIPVARPPTATGPRSPIPVARPPMSSVPSPIPTFRPPIPVPVRTPTTAPVPVMTKPPPQLLLRIPNIVPGQYMPVPAPITERPLGDWQLEWFTRVRQILTENYGYIDTSQPGAGKTSLCLWIAKAFNLPVLVITEAGIVDAGVWPREARLVNASHLLVGVISYNTLAGKKFKQPSHPYLTSLDRMSEGGIVQTRFDATDYFKNIAARGCLLVFDEFSNLKNTSRKLKASLELLANVITDGGPSRYALLSGTPFDKEGHAINILKALRYIRSPRLYYKDPITKQITLEGLHQLIEACRLLDAVATANVLAEYNIDGMNSDMSESLVYNLYTNVIKKSISGSMPAPPTEGLFEQYNGFFNINPEDNARLQQAIKDLATAVRFDVNTGQIMGKNKGFANATPALRIIEFAKARDMIRVARSYLAQFPTMKVVLGVNYTETVDLLMSGLADYGTIQFDGRVKGKRRANIEDTFRNSPNHRVLIGNIRVIGKGLSFQGLTPDALRLTILSPSYNLLDISQAAYRTNRAGKKGDAYVYVFYGQGAGIELETNILDAMVRKSGVVKGTLDENGNELRLPGEYTPYYEPLTN